MSGILRVTVVAFFLWVCGCASAVAAVREFSVADSLMNILNARLTARDFAVGELGGTLYVKQNIDVRRKNLLLNVFPDMTRFDKGEKRYLSELFYDVHYLDYAVPDVRRRASITTHRHGSGEIERVLAFMSPDIYDEEILEDNYLSPLYRFNRRLYKYSVDTLYSDTARTNVGCTKILFEQRFENIKLLSSGWVLLDDSCTVREFYAEGWDEQNSFKVHYTMGTEGLRRFAVHHVSLLLDYKFAGNRLAISADGVFDFSKVEPLSAIERKSGKYDITGSLNNMLDAAPVGDFKEYAHEHRRLPLAAADSAIYMEKGVFTEAFSPDASVAENKNGVDYWLWTIGDEMISSHSMEWQGMNVKMSPILNPSYIDYTSSRGLSYRMVFRLNANLAGGRYVQARPSIGYNFKQQAVYWDVTSNYMFDPLHLGSTHLEFGLGNSTYSSLVLDRIKDIACDSLDFDDLNLNYFKNFYLNFGVQRELANGLEMLVGFNFHRRVLKGGAHDELQSEGYSLKKRYTQFAPHVRLTWQPGMYYYIQNNRKINVGSHFPRFSLDVEQGVRGILGSSSVYTSAEIDVQYNYKVNESDVLYMRMGGGGFFYTKDVYFIEYAFLKQNNLPVDRNDELGGVFQLLDADWYNSANKYFRTNVTYESPFMMLQKFMPHVKFIKHERLYHNMLVMSHLRPYSEIGYGVETPYIDVGLFLSSKNLKFHRIGYKITLSLFRD